MPADRVLLVEGNADKLFFKEICAVLGVSAEIHVAVPKDYSGSHNSKQAVIQTIHVLIKQLADGSLKQIAAIVDADYKESNGLGCGGTLDQITALTKNYGFNQRHRVGQGGGFLFEHNDGFSPLGVWIMPNNMDDGMKEDWAIASASADEQAALKYAGTVLHAVPGGIKYKSNHHQKAVAAVWMAWQANPGQGLHQAVKNGLIDMSKPAARNLEAWLKKTFS